MAKPQFAHIMTHSMKGNANTRPLEDILNEAGRVRENCPHVSDPMEPTLLYGIMPTELVCSHRSEIDDRNRKIKQHNQGHPDDRIEPIRKTTHTLSSLVVSYPEETAEVRADMERRELFKVWLQRARDLALWDAKKRNLELRSIVLHLDEKHPHIHAYGVAQSDARLNVKNNHPGILARDLAVKQGQSGKAAYTAAMERWQDKAHMFLGTQFGHARYGDREPRVKRKEWRAVTQELKDLHQNCASAKEELALYNRHLDQARAESRLIMENAQIKAADILRAADVEPLCASLARLYGQVGNHLPSLPDEVTSLLADVAKDLQVITQASTANEAAFAHYNAEIFLEEVAVHCPGLIDDDDSFDLE